MHPRKIALRLIASVVVAAGVASFFGTGGGSPWSGIGGGGSGCAGFSISETPTIDVISAKERPDFQGNEWFAEFDAISKLYYCYNNGNEVRLTDVGLRMEYVSGNASLDCHTGDAWSPSTPTDGSYRYRAWALSPPVGPGGVAWRWDFQPWEKKWDKTLTNAFIIENGAGHNTSWVQIDAGGNVIDGGPLSCGVTGAYTPPAAVECWFGGIWHYTWENETTWHWRRDDAIGWCAGVS